ncbi:unnamed protein product [Orchesella dallaii]|uniref:BED-type domain-containing protein n=1 Tax=Orchesella dallaii TaxID=48710 RepID=A0ABP1PL90_9HEXA
MPNQKRKRRSAVWNHFKSNEDHTFAECSHCLKSFRTNGGCTSGLTRHLETHAIYLREDAIQNHSNRPQLNAVVTVLYANNTHANLELEVSEDEEDEDMASTESPLLAQTDIEGAELIPDLNGLIAKVRRTVKLFRKSELKTEVLRRYAPTT